MTFGEALLCDFFANSLMHERTHGLVKVPLRSLQPDMLDNFGLWRKLLGHCLLRSPQHKGLEGAQRDLYETVRSLMHQRVREEIAKKGLAKSHIIFLDALLKLRQIRCDPRLLNMPQAQKVKRSAKLERLMEMIPEMVGEGRKSCSFHSLRVCWR